MRDRLIVSAWACPCEFDAAITAAGPSITVASNDALAIASGSGFVSEFCSRLTAAACARPAIAMAALMVSSVSMTVRTFREFSIEENSGLSRTLTSTPETQRGARPGAAHQYDLFGCGRANSARALGRRYRIRRYRMNADVGALWADVELACVTD